MLNFIDYLRYSTINNIDTTKISQNAKELLDTAIFIPWEYCPNCYRSKRLKKLNIEDILGGFRKDELRLYPNNVFFNFKNEKDMKIFKRKSSEIDFNIFNEPNNKNQNNKNYNISSHGRSIFDDSFKYSTCAICLMKFIPNIYILKENSTNFDDLIIVELRSPMALIKSIDALIEQFGDKFFFVSEYYNDPEYKVVFWNIAYYFQLFNLPNFVLSTQKNEEYLKMLVEDLKFIRENPKKRHTVNANGSTTSRVNTGVSDFTSRKQSTASNDAISIFSSPNVKLTGIAQYENNLMNIIRSFVEKEKIFIEEKDKDNISVDKNELNNQTYHIRNVSFLNIFKYLLLDGIKTKRGISF